MISSKGFFFTISIILFATTLVFYSQMYSDFSVNRESYIINSYKLSFVPFIIDDISTDVLSIMGIDFDKEFKEDSVYITISGEFPKTNVSNNVINYKNFLDNNYFTKSIGQKNIDFSNLLNNNFIIDLSGNTFVYDYNNSIIYLKNDFNYIDLNIFVSTSDLNYYEYFFNSSEESNKFIRINYFDDTNSLIFPLQEIDTSDLSYLNLVYTDANILLTFGINNDNYFVFDSNIESEVKYYLLFENYFDNNIFRSNSNIIFNYKLEEVDVNSFIKIN